MAALLPRAGQLEYGTEDESMAAESVTAALLIRTRLLGFGV